MLYYDAKI
jgi:hypothetical protein